jgi:hypothetical protein
MLSGKARYSASGEVPTELTHEYEQIGKYAQTIFESRIKARAPGDSEITGLTIPFVKIISLLKDDYFSNEAEARIVAFRPQKKSKTTHVTLSRIGRLTVSVFHTSKSLMGRFSENTVPLSG